MGTVAPGEVEKGVLRVPANLRVLAAEPRPEAPATVRVVQAYAHRKPVTEVAPGTPALLTLEGLAGEHVLPGSRRRRWPVKEGDRLVFP
jgi:hypothetical protein